MKSIVLKEWMRIALSICLLGLPVILGYFSIQIVETRNTEIAKDALAPALGSEFDFSRPSGIMRGKVQTSQPLPLQKFDGQTFRAVTTFRAADAGPASSDSKHVTTRGWQDTNTADWHMPVIASFGEWLTSGRLLSVVAGPYLSQSSRGFTPHKNGRLIDTASYIHRTIR